MAPRTPFLLLAVMAVSLAAQDSFPRETLEIGGGAAVPAAGLSRYMSSSPMFRVAYGHRFHRYVQADAGLEIASGAAGVHTVERSSVGDITITDSELLATFGGRAVLPLAHDRLELHVGGGGAHLHYGEDASLPRGVKTSGLFDVACPKCRSRGGWGHYGMAGAAVALDRRGRYWLGLDARLVRGTTSGQALGSIPKTRTKDQWINTSMVLMFRW